MIEKAEVVNWVRNQVPQSKIISVLCLLLRARLYYRWGRQSLSSLDVVCTFHSLAVLSQKGIQAGTHQDYQTDRETSNVCCLFGGLDVCLPVCPSVECRQT